MSTTRSTPLAESNEPPASSAGDARRSRHSVTVVIPTRNEGDNIEELVRQLDSSLGSIDAEVLFVDDSDDNTPDVIEHVAFTTSRRVRLIHRSGASRTGGLGGAIVAGFRTVESPWAVVMDGDLQHPPQVVPQLVQRAHRPDVNLVVATRYNGGGDSSGLSNRWRVLVSVVCTALARVFFPRKLRSVSDPMSGFFAVRLDAVDLDTLRPAGYKILLEIVARSQLGQAAQVPFSFQQRFTGESKASTREAYLFLRQLLRLRVAASMDTLRRVARFLLVGGSGIVVNTAVMALLLRATPMSYLTASVLGTHVAILWNYLILRAWVFGAGSKGSFAAGLARFWLLNAALLPVQLGLLALLVSGFGVAPEPANVVVLAAIFVLRYAVSAAWVFRPVKGAKEIDITDAALLARSPATATSASGSAAGNGEGPAMGATR